MKTTQAWGWLAAGVLAAGLNAAYHDGGLEWAHRIADRVQHGSAAVVALAGGRADQFVAEAALLSARNDTDRENETGSFSDATLANAQYGVARAEGVYARAEAIAAREQAHMARIQTERTRIDERLAAHRACVHIAVAQVRPVAFPSMSMSMQIPGVNIPQITVPQITIPRIEIPQVNLGPACRRVPVSVPEVPQFNVPMAFSTSRKSTPDSEALFSTE